MLMITEELIKLRNPENPIDYILLGAKEVVFTEIKDYGGNKWFIVPSYQNYGLSEKEIRRLKDKGALKIRKM